MKDLKPLTDAELADMERWADRDLGAHAEEGDADRLRSMVFEIRMHRDAMAPSILRAARLYTDELGALRRRVAELERVLSETQVAYKHARLEAGALPSRRVQLVLKLVQDGRITQAQADDLLVFPQLETPLETPPG